MLRLASGTDALQLSACRRRVLKNARAQEQRRDPGRSKGRKFGKLNGNRRSSEHRRGERVIVIAGRDQSNGAFVLRVICVGMDALVQLWRRRKSGRKKKRAD